MSYAVGYDSTNQRDIGYGVPCECEHPNCTERINRGMGYACGGGFPEDGCGRYFCGKHGGGASKCSMCSARRKPVALKPDLLEWTHHKCTDPSWAKWRAENKLPEPFGVTVTKQRMQESDGTVTWSACLRCNDPREAITLSTPGYQFATSPSEGRVDYEIAEMRHMLRPSEWPEPDPSDFNLEHP